MIKERCLLDLLEEEKKAVSDYNSLIDNYGFIISHYTELSKEHPKMKEFSDMLWMKFAFQTGGKNHE